MYMHICPYDATIYVAIYSYNRSVAQKLHVMQ